MRHKAYEWQALSQKKDVENIRKKISKTQEIGIAIAFDIAIAIIAICLDHFISMQTNPNDSVNYAVYLWIVCGIGLLPFIILGLKYLIECIRTKHEHVRFLSTDELIDIFDNESCYSIMMASSYCQLLQELPEESIEGMGEFYYIEINFHINRTITHLLLMSSKIKTIFTLDVEKAFSGKYILYDRLRNIFNLIEDISKLLDSYETKLKIDNIQKSKELKQRYLDSYYRFKTKTNKELGFDK